MMSSSSSNICEAYINGELDEFLPFRSLLTYAPPPTNNNESSEIPKRASMRLGEKARILKKLLPVEKTKKRMDVATVLEETYKYIRFLQAQITLLNAMPPAHHPLFEALLNSPAAQVEMYSKGCCLYSVDHLLFLNHDDNDAN